MDQEALLRFAKTHGIHVSKAKTRIKNQKNSAHFWGIKAKQAKNAEEAELLKELGELYAEAADVERDITTVHNKLCGHYGYRLKNGA